MYGWPVCEPACPKAVGQPTPLLVSTIFGEGAKDMWPMIIMRNFHINRAIKIPRNSQNHWVVQVYENYQSNKHKQCDLPMRA